MKGSGCTKLTLVSAGPAPIKGPTDSNGVAVGCKSACQIDPNQGMSHMLIFRNQAELLGNASLVPNSRLPQLLQRESQHCRYLPTFWSSVLQLLQ